MIVKITFRCEPGDIKKAWSCLTQAFLNLFLEWVCDENFAQQEIVFEGQLPKEYWKDKNIFGKVKIELK